MTADLNRFQAQVAAMEQRYQQEISSLRALHQQSEQRYHRVSAQLKFQTGLAMVVITLVLLLAPTNHPARAQGTMNTLESRVAALENKTQFMSANAQAHSTVFARCNVFIQNGLGATNGFPANPTSVDPTRTRTNGLGNLIIGYNEGRESAALDHRTGSHNVIVGQMQNYTSYGGLVGGHGNTVSGVYASVSGGDGNEATGSFASISGGAGNVASGRYASSVSGGGDNIASGEVSSVSGGSSNQARFTFTSISGGYRNLATGSYASVSGGDRNQATNGAASVSGGVLNVASGFDSSVTGGQNNQARGAFSAVSGGVGIIQTNTSGWSANIFHAP